MQKQEKYEIPFIKVKAKDLPSRGLTYPPDAEVSYRTYAFGEVKMSSISSPDIVSTIESVAEGIKIQGFGVRQMTFMDLLYIGTLRKVSTQQKSSYTMPYVCEHCGNEQELKFNETQLEFREVDQKVTEFPLVVPGIRGTQDLHFSPVTVDQMLNLYKGVYKDVIKGGMPDKTALLAISVVNMGFKDAYELLYSLTDPEDIELVHEADKLMMHDLKPLIATCVAEVERNGSKKICNGKNEVVLQGREALIRPFRTGDQPARRSISFGLSQHSECATDK